MCFITSEKAISLILQYGLLEKLVIFIFEINDIVIFT